MKQAKIADLKNSLSRYLDYVRRGGRVRVLDRNTPVAEIVPLGTGASSSCASDDGRLAELERQGILTRATTKIGRELLERKLPKSRASVVAALLAERADGR